MKKRILIPAGLLAFTLALALGAYMLYQQMPEKRFARHLGKARLYAKHQNFQAAHEEYVRAYELKEGFTPYAALEVSLMENAWLRRLGKPGEALENARRFVKAHPENLAGRQALAELALDLAHLEEALSELQFILEREPKHFGARRLLALARTSQGRHDLAEVQLRTLCRQYPDSLDMVLPLAHSLLLQRRPEEARELLRDLLRRRSQYGLARLYLVDSYLLQNEIDSARKEMEAWKAADTSFAMPVDIRNARVLAAWGKQEKALALLSPHLERKPEFAPAHREMAFVRVRLGQIDAALSLYSDLPEFDPSARLEAQFNRFFLTLHKGAPAQALEILKRMEVEGAPADSLAAFEVAAYMAMDERERARDIAARFPRQGAEHYLAEHLHPPSFATGWALQRFFQRNERTEPALRQARNLVERYPGNDLAGSILASLELRLGFLEAAARTLSGLKNPSIAQRLDLAATLLRLDKPHEALAQAKRLLSEHSSFPGPHRLAGDALFRLGKSQEALAHWRKELAVNPRDLVCLNNLAWELGVRQGDRKRALPYLEALIKAEHDEPRIHDTVGWLLALSGRPGEGEEHLRKALILAPGQPSLLYRLARIRLMQGRPQADTVRAKALLDSALKAAVPFPEHKEAAALRDSLARS